MLWTPQLKPLPFQEEVIDFGLRNPYILDGLQMGLGKSYCSIVTAVERRDKKSPKTLVVCPSYLKLNWQKEILKIYPDAQVMILDHHDYFFKPWDTDFVIISYSFLHKADVLFEWAREVIFDEAHLLKNISTIRSNAAHRLIFENENEFCQQLSGTPIENRVYEFWSSLAICNYNPRIAESSFLKEFPTYIHFANHFSHVKEYSFYRKGKRVTQYNWEGYRNVDELKEWIKDIFISRKTDDVLDMLPSIEIDIPVSYDNNPQLLEEFLKFTNASDEVIDGLEAKAKAALATAPFSAEYTKNIVDQYGQAILYTDHVQSCELMAEKLGVQPITGKLPAEKRQKFADDFMARKTDVVVATIGSFNTGYTMTSAYNMVFNDLPFNPSKLKQAMYRIRRIGQTEQCIFHRILGSIQSEKILKMLLQKMETIDAII